MNLSDVFKKCASIRLDLDLSDEKVVKDLELCYTLVECELATRYFPLIVKEKFYTNGDNIIRYKDFTYSPTSIVRCTDEYGRNLRYRIFPECLFVKANTVNVKYSKYPEVKTINDKSDYSKKYLNALAYGTLAEYSLMKGLRVEAKCYLVDYYYWVEKHKKGKHKNGK